MVSVQRLLFPISTNLYVPSSDIPEIAPVTESMVAAAGLPGTVRQTAPVGALPALAVVEGAHMNLSGTFDQRGATTTVIVSQYIWLPTQLAAMAKPHTRYLIIVG